MLTFVVTCAGELLLHTETRKDHDGTIEHVFLDMFCETIVIAHDSVDLLFNTGIWVDRI